MEEGQDERVDPGEHGGPSDEPRVGPDVGGEGFPLGPPGSSLALGCWRRRRARLEPGCPRGPRRRHLPGFKGGVGFPMGSSGDPRTNPGRPLTMLKHLGNALLLGVLLALPARSQQACSKLAVTTEPDPVRSKQTVTLDVAGVPSGAVVYAVVGRNLGTTVINFRSLGSLELGIARPFTAAVMGTADNAGNLSRSMRIPSELAFAVNVQAVGFKVTTTKGTPKAEFCPSNVVKVDL